MNTNIKSCKIKNNKQSITNNIEKNNVANSSKILLEKIKKEVGFQDNNEKSLSSIPDIYKSKLINCKVKIDNNNSNNDKKYIIKKNILDSKSNFSNLDNLLKNTSNICNDIIDHLNNIKTQSQQIVNASMSDYNTTTDINKMYFKQNIALKSEILNLKLKLYINNSKLQVFTNLINTTKIKLEKEDLDKQKLKDIYQRHCCLFTEFLKKNGNNDDENYENDIKKVYNTDTIITDCINLLEKYTIDKNLTFDDIFELKKNLIFQSQKFLSFYLYDKNLTIDTSKNILCNNLSKDAIEDKYNINLDNLKNKLKDILIEDISINKEKNFNNSEDILKDIYKFFIEDYENKHSNFFKINYLIKTNYNKQLKNIKDEIDMYIVKNKVISSFSINKIHCKLEQIFNVFNNYYNIYYKHIALLDSAIIYYKDKLNNNDKYLSNLIDQYLKLTDISFLKELLLITNNSCDRLNSKKLLNNEKNNIEDYYILNFLNINKNKIISIVHNYQNLYNIYNNI